MAEPIERPGGIALFNTNQRADSDDVNRIGTMAEQSLYDGILARVMAGADGFFGADCLPSKGAGDLDYLVEPGVGLFKDTAEADAFEPIYKPIFIAAQQSGTLSAHDPTNPRIDILTLAPATVDDENDTRKILTAGVLTPTSVDTRRRRAFTLGVVAGTPAGSPSVPATPAGTIKIAEITVPATSGPITVTDVRPKVGTVEDGVADAAITTPKIADQAVTPAKLSVVPVVWEGSANPESGNAIVYDLQASDVDGGDISRTQLFLATVYDYNGVADAAAFTVDISSGGSALSNAPNARVLFSPGGDGGCSIVVTDVSGTYSGAVMLKIEPIHDENNVQPGYTFLTSLVFS